MKVFLSSSKLLACVVLALIVCAGVSACGLSSSGYQRSGGLGEIVFKKNAHETRVAEGVYILKVKDMKDKNEIPPMRLMLFFASELTLEQGYGSFVMLPSKEGLNRFSKPPEVATLRVRVESGEFNDYMKKPSLTVTNMSKCHGVSCRELYAARATIVMLKRNSNKNVRSLDARKINEKIKPLIPGGQKRAETIHQRVDFISVGSGNPNHPMIKNRTLSPDGEEGSALYG